MSRALVPVLGLVGLLAGSSCGPGGKLVGVCTTEACSQVEVPSTDSGIPAEPDAGSAPDAGASVTPDAGSTVDSGAPDAGQPVNWCSDGGWCREGQAPDGGWLTARRLNAVFARTQLEVYVAGDYGTLLRSDGFVWTRAATWGPADDLFTVGASAANDVWVGGIIGDPMAQNGMFARFDGANFNWIYKPLTRRPQGMVVRAGEVVAVGAGGELKHFTNNSWFSEPWLTNESINDITQVGSDLWAVGSNGFVASQKSGGSWTPYTLPPSPMTVGELKSIVGFGSGKAVAAGGEDLLEFDGTTWTHRRLTGLQMNSVWGETEQRVWAVGPAGQAWRIEGSNVTPLNTGVTVDLLDVHGVDEHHIWAVGEGGVILRLR
jgi:hypothetical protein